MSSICRLARFLPPPPLPPAPLAAADHGTTFGGTEDVRTSENNTTTEPPPTKLTFIIAGGKTLTVACENIVAVKAVGKEAVLHHRVRGVSSGAEKVICAIVLHSLSAIEERLSTHPDIVRCHRSVLVNLAHCLRWQHNGKKALVMLDGGSTLPVSQSHKAVFTRLLDNYQAAQGCIAV